MKFTLQHHTIRKLIGVIAVGAFAFVPAMGIISAQADPPRHAPAYGRRDKNSKGRYDRNRNSRNRRNDRNRNNRNNHNQNNRNRNNDYRSYAGVVTKVHSKKKFDIRADGRTYNVTLSNNAPRNLSRNDYVRVYGKRSGNNDIKNASVSILRRR
jgi:hypothetical protein